MQYNLRGSRRESCHDFKMQHGSCIHLHQNGLQMWGHACGAGSPVRSPCDFSTKAQECSGIVDRQLHPPALPSGSPVINLNTDLQLSLHQPQGVMLMHPATGALIPLASDMLLNIRAQPASVSGPETGVKVCRVFIQSIQTLEDGKQTVSAAVLDANFWVHDYSRGIAWDCHLH